ncbi:DUF2726 domain-containing protein [Aquabacterium sp.]|uniref:DUF2726 domain-containing protein n=1 Tax=Aquabacterium sp. TaxID=1872578 RepID=UPI0035B210D4
MDALSFPLMIAVALVAVVALMLWLRMRRSRQTDAASSQPRGLDALDTVAAWEPEPSRILTATERQAYAVLRQAFPDHMVLGQVPLSRFLRVPTRNSYSVWVRRVGHLCADLVVCNRHSEVLAVVEVRCPPERESPRTAKRHSRMDRVIEAAGIRLHVWRDDQIPSVSAARASVLVTPPSQEVSSPAAAALPPIDSELPEANEMAEFREPPPSTWFEDLDSAPMPLEPAGR